MTEITPGDYVECVIGGQITGMHCGSATITQGALYKCVNLKEANIPDGLWACGLCGDKSHLFVVLAERTASWCPTRFRPVIRPHGSVFTGELAPTDKELEDA